MVQQISSQIEKGSYPEVVSILILFNDSKANLTILEKEHLELEEEIRKCLTDTFERLFAQVRKECQKLKPDSAQNVTDAIDSFESKWNLLKAAKGELFMTQMKRFGMDEFINKEIDSFQSDLDSLYQTNFEQIEQKCRAQEDKVDLK